MALSADLSLMDLLLDKDDNLLNFEKDIIGEDTKFNLDKSAEEWTDDINLFDSLLDLESSSHNFDLLQLNNEFEKTVLSPPPYSVVESSSSSDSGVSSDQPLSPMVHELDDDEDNDEDIIEEVVYDEEIYAEPVVKEEVVEVDNEEPEMDILQMESVDVKEENDQPVITLNVSQVQPVKKPALVKPIPIVGPRRMIRVTPIQTNNPRSILIPVNGVSGVRTIKIINAGSKSRGSLNARARQMLNNSSVITTVDDDSTSETSDDHESSYPMLQLTSEEKRLMVKEGVTLPSHYPLTKHEERELKRIRRKIRNKISAQDSRKRKKEYVDGLEDRVKQCTEENLTLLKRLKVLQSQNQCLSTQLKRLQAAVVRGTGHTTQPATCLMVLVLSLALVMAPNLRSSSRPVSHQDLQIPDPKAPLAGRSRTLLFSKPLEEMCYPVDTPVEGEDIDNKKLMMDLEELLKFSKPQQDDHDYTQAYTVGKKRAKTYIVPDIDDTWPPPKVARIESTVTLHNKTRQPPGKYVAELPD